MIALRRTTDVLAMRHFHVRGKNYIRPKGLSKLKYRHITYNTNDCLFSRVIHKLYSGCVYVYTWPSESRRDIVGKVKNVLSIWIISFRYISLNMYIRVSEKGIGDSTWGI